MSFPDAVKSVLTKYAQFSGRARRSEYWFFVLFNFLVGIVAAVVDAVLSLNNTIGPYGPLSIVTSLGLFIPGLAVAVRRLHDTDRSGWWIFLGLIPLIGAIILLIWFCTEGTRGANSRGEDPKGLPTPLAGGPGYGQPGGYGPPGEWGSPSPYGQPGPEQPYQDRPGEYGPPR